MKRPGHDDIARIVTFSPILQELPQGFKDIPAYPQIRDELLAIPRLADPIPVNLFLDAAEIYRLARRKGHTIRSSVDCLIAATAISKDVPVVHLDRDFD